MRASGSSEARRRAGGAVEEGAGPSAAHRSGGPTARAAGAVPVERALRALALLVAVVVTTHLLLGLLPDDGFGLGTVREILHVDREPSLPTWIATGLLTLCGLAAALLARLERLPFPGWLGLAAVFVAASADEMATFHEQLTDPVKAALDLSGWLRFAWVVPGAIVAAVVALLFVRMILALPPHVRRGLAFGAGLFLLGALGVEMVGAKLKDEVGIASLPYHLVVTVEESLEFSGALVWLGVLLRRLRDLDRGGEEGGARSGAARRPGRRPAGGGPPLR